MRFLFRLDLSLHAGAEFFFLKFWFLQPNTVQGLQVQAAGPASGPKAAASAVRLLPVRATTPTRREFLKTRVESVMTLRI